MWFGHQRCAPSAICGAAAACLAFGCAELADVDPWGAAPNAASSGSGASSTSVGGAGGAAGGGAGAASGGAAQSYVDVVLGDQPVGYWRLGEGAGERTAVDASETANHGLYGADVTLGLEGLIEGDPDSAARFAGSLGSEVAIGDKLDFTGNAPFTLEVWAKPATVTLGYPVFKRTGAPHEGYELRIERDRVAALRWIADSAQGVNAPPLLVETIAHVVARYDGDAQDLCLFVNGALAACVRSTGSIADTAAPLTLGRLLSGTLDEVAIYAHALADERIAAHWAAGAGRR